MYAHLHSARLAPKKANIVAKMVRGLTVPDAMELLRRTSKKSARILEGLLRSAIANAQHNFKQDAQTLVLKSIVVNQGTAYRRGTPMARGRVRPLKKFLSHISIELGVAPAGGEERKQKYQKTSKKSTSAKAEQSSFSSHSSSSSHSSK